MATWGDLNKRQQKYLQAIYEVDQDQERYIKWLGSQGRYVRQPASEWRWMHYNADSAPLYSKLSLQKLINPGSGSTFEALATRGLILRKWEPGALMTSILCVQITPKGRKLVRTALGIKPQGKTSVGTLQEWHWRALCRAYVRGEQGMGGYDNDLDDGFGYVSWKTCLRLRDYHVKGQDQALIREALRSRGETGGLRITDYGKQYYRENWQRYRELYPNVEAPAPHET